MPNPNPPQENFDLLQMKSSWVTWFWVFRKVYPSGSRSFARLFFKNPLVQQELRETGLSIQKYLERKSPQDWGDKFFKAFLETDQASFLPQLISVKVFLKILEDNRFFPQGLWSSIRTYMLSVRRSTNEKKRGCFLEKLKPLFEQAKKEYREQYAGLNTEWKILVKAMETACSKQTFAQKDFYEWLKSMETKRSILQTQHVKGAP